MAEFRDTAPSAPAVFYRSYARRKSDGRRESYKEAITRTVNDLAKIGGLTKEQKSLCLEMGLKQHAFPSGRALWVAGSEWSKKPENFYGYYNCLSGDTLVLTRKGYRTAREISAPSYGPVEVVNALGEWSEVAFRSHGTQDLLRVEFGRTGSKGQVVNCTYGHHWPTICGHEESGAPKILWKTTAELLPGDKIPRVLAPKPTPSLAGIQHGIIYGDGTRSGNRFFVDLCGAKIKELSRFFEDQRQLKWQFRCYSDPSSNVDLKSLPDPYLGDEYLYGFIQGLLATDGSVGLDGSLQLSGGWEALRFVADHAPRLGLLTGEPRLVKAAGSMTNLGPRRSDLYCLWVHRASFHAEDLLRDSMRRRVRPAFRGGAYWTVKSYPEFLDREEEVFCTIEPVTHAFVLADGLLTGNCHGGILTGLHVFGRLMDLAMCGTGTGVLLEKSLVEALPVVSTAPVITRVIENPGKTGGEDFTTATHGRTDDGDTLVLRVGDSRKGWVDAYQALIYTAFDQGIHSPEVSVTLDLSQVRQKGQRLKGFGGVANPAGLEAAFRKVCAIFKGARGRRLTTVEACLLVDEAASAVVAGNLRRSAGIRLFSSDDEEAKSAKLGLYKQDEQGNWSVDPARESLRLANHTICYHHKPTLQEVRESVEKQFRSGEGAIQFSPEAIARANADLLLSEEFRRAFIRLYTTKGKEAAKVYLKDLSEMLGVECDELLLEHRVHRYSANPCHEIIGNDFMCNLGEVHLNTIDPKDRPLQYRAFYATGLMVGALLKHRFPDPELQYSREVDPIVAVCLSGLFDFFVEAFGVDWLDWMAKGRPTGARCKRFTEAERDYLEYWRGAAYQGVADYCEQAGLKMPNRYTAVQPAGSKSLLTGASPGWHPPKAQRFIRRITFGVDDPLVAALRDYGYSVVPAQSARDEDGNLLNDVSDPRVREVLVEIPTEVPWANLPGAEKYDPSQIPVEAQFGLYMQVQKYYSTHTTSATIEFREHEIDTLAELIHREIQEDGGYIGAALLARFDANETFPRLPFEPISKEEYNRRMAIIAAYRTTLRPGVTILDLLEPYDHPDHVLAPQDTACANGACVAKLEKEEAMGLS